MGKPGDLPVYVLIIIIIAVVISVIALGFKIYYICSEEDEEATVNPENVIFIRNVQTSNIVIEVPLHQTSQQTSNSQSYTYQHSTSNSTRSTHSPKPSAPSFSKSDDPPSYNDAMDGIFGQKK